jgi:2-dehydro-3-deoxyglucarate aldolase/4-hydroxy-2-oxoheptanedioate aldolase
MDASFKAKLAGGARLVGTILTLPAPELADIAAGAGFDWLFLDMEHGLLDIAAAQRMAQAAGACPCLIRVPANETVWIKKAMDIGAAGLIFPNIKSAEEAARAVREAKYPPEGVRSVGIGRAQGYGARFAEYVEKANADTTLVSQVEHIDGVRNIEAILGTPGVDAVFVGPFDLSASMGKPGCIGDADVQEAIGIVRKACAARGIPAGIFAPDETAAGSALEQGFSLVCVGMDVTLYGGAARQILEALKH